MQKVPLGRESACLVLEGSVVLPETLNLHIANDHFSHLFRPFTLDLCNVPRVPLELRFRGEQGVVFASKVGVGFGVGALLRRPSARSDPFLVGVARDLSAESINLRPEPVALRPRRVEFVAGRGA